MSHSAGPDSLCDESAGHCITRNRKVATWLERKLSIGPAAEKTLAATVIAFLALVTTAHAQVIFIDGFEAPPAPAIVSTPVLAGAVGELYEYDVEAIDPDDDPLAFSLTDSPAGMTVDPSSGLVSWTPASTGSFGVTVVVTDNEDGSDQQSWIIEVVQSGGAEPVPSPIDETVATSFPGAVEFLYDGPSAIQVDIQEGALEDKRVGVVRGTVLTRDGTPLPGVQVSILGQPAIGFTLTRSDGAYDLAANGGGSITVEYELEGFLTAQRRIELPWHQYRTLDPVRLVPLSPAVTTIDLARTDAPAALGEVEVDGDGERRGMLMFQPGTSAEMALPDGSLQPLSTIDVRITEYTVGPNGPEAMPAELPPTSGYTYAAEFSVDEAILAGATRVFFNPAAVFYLDNFLDFPVGTPVPLGGYDRLVGQWEGAPDGLVIQIVGENANGEAEVDLDGDGLADDPTAIGMTSEERIRLALLHDVGTELWRAEIPHFSSWDCNWPFGPPDGAEGPRPEHGPDPTGFNPERDCPTFNFSRVDCQSQVLREEILIPGTSQALHYRSDRAAGYVAGRTLDVRIPAADIPDIAAEVVLTLEVAGARQSQTHSATGDIDVSLTWDGRDAYGRRVYGPQPYELTVSFGYDGNYSFSASGSGGGGGSGSGGRQSFFSQPGISITGSLSRSLIFLSRRYTGQMKGLAPQPAGFGEWTMSDHHSLLVEDGTLVLGSGDIRGNAGGFADEFVERTDLVVRRFNSTRSNETSALPMPDGSVLVGTRGSGNGQVYRVESDGTSTLIAGSSSSFASLNDGLNATFVRLPSDPLHLTRLLDGRILFSQGRVLRVIETTGRIDTMFGEDGLAGALPIQDNLDYVGPANALDMGGIRDVAAGPDGTTYVIAQAIDSVSDTIWRVTPEGTASRVAGTTVGAGQVAGQQAIVSEVVAQNLAVDGNGDIYYSDSGVDRVWRISGGELEAVAGSGICSGNWLDEGPALSTELCSPGELAIAPDGSLFVASAFACIGDCDLNTYTQRIYHYDGEQIRIIAGGFNVGEYIERGYALGNRIGNFDADLHFTPAGELLYKTRTGTEDIFLIVPAPESLGGLDLLSNVQAGQIPVPSSDGRYIYLFDAQGRHLSTYDNFLQREILTFSYDAGNNLVALTDVYGSTTTIERDGAGIATAIVGPDGQRTEVAFKSSQLTGLVDPAGDAHQFAYNSPSGALSSQTDPRGNSSNYVYGSRGRLIQATNRDGGTITLQRSVIDAETIEVVETRRGTEETRYLIERSGGNIVKTVTDPTGATRVIVRGSDGVTEGAFPDGTIARYEEAPDPRFGAFVRRVGSSTIETPAGLTSTQSVEVNVSYNVPGDITTMTEWEELLTRNGRTSRTHYDVVTRTLTFETPEGRIGRQVFDEFGALVSQQPPGAIATTTYTYDAAGRITSITRLNESVAIAYDASGYPITATDSENGVTTWTNDAVGRLLSATLPSGRTFTFTLDGNGNRVSVETPENEVHQLGYDPNDRLESYALPGASPLQLDIDGLGRREGVAYPDGSIRNDLFQDALPVGAVMPDATLTIGHASEIAGPGKTENIDFLSRQSGLMPVQAVDYELDGRLVTAQETTGPSAARVEYTYATPDRMTGRTLDSEPTIAFAYNDDNLLIGIGPFTFFREPATALMESIGDGTMTIDIGLDARTGLVSRALAHSAAPVHDLALTRDDLTRIVTRIDTLGAVITERNYSYDADDRLIEVRDGSNNLVEAFTYDGNGNRLSHTTGAGVKLASYDSQDRLIVRDGLSYAYDANGFLSARGADTFEYTPDGVLRSATFAGVTVEYAYDFLGRRVARTDAGGTGTFVYGNLEHPFRVTSSTAPDATITEYFYDDSGFLFAFRRAGAWFYVGTDQVGSPRVVVDGVTGAVVKTLEYSAFGELLADSNPAFALPVGYAGGLADPVGDLVRFGLRDYEPAAGRFTGRDPLLLAGGTTNFYAYVTNDPINYRDISGLLIKIGASAYGGLGGGVSLTISGSGIGLCVEGGVGVGGGVGFEKADLSPGGVSAVVAGGVGPFGTGVELPFDDCFASGNPTIGWDGASLASERVNQGFNNRTNNLLDRADERVNQLPGRRGRLARGIGEFPSKLPKAIRPKASVKAEASAFLRGCFPPLTW